MSNSSDLRKALTVALNGMPETNFIDDVYDGITASNSPDEDDMGIVFTSSDDNTITGLILNGESRMSSSLGGSAFTSMSMLTDKGRSASAIQLPQVAGTRVRFVANIGSVLTYDNVPDPSITGMVVTVKTADGPVTDQGGRVFVAWDDGVFRPIFAEHLRLAGPSQRRSSNVRMVVGSLGDISSMFTANSREGELIHRSTKDLWAVKKDGGNFVIERLFNDEGKPLKV